MERRQEKCVVFGGGYYRIVKFYCYDFYNYSFFWAYMYDTLYLVFDMWNCSFDIDVWDFVFGLQ